MPRNPSPSASGAPAQSLPPPGNGKDNRRCAKCSTATRHFQNSRYDQAIAEFQLAYTKRQLPTLLFNIAQAHRKAATFPKRWRCTNGFSKTIRKSALLPEAEAHAAAMRADDAERASAEREAAERLAKKRTEEAEAWRLPARRNAKTKHFAGGQSQRAPGLQKGLVLGIIGGIVAASAITAGL